MNFRKILAALLVVVLLLGVSITLFACENAKDIEEIKQKTKITDEAFLTAFANLTNASNLTFEMTSTQTQNVTYPDDHTKDSTSNGNVDLIYNMASNYLFGYSNSYNSQTIMAFNERTVYSKQYPTDEWEDMKNGYMAALVESLYERSYYPTLQEGETLTFGKIFSGNPSIKPVLTLENYTLNREENGKFYINDFSHDLTYDECLEFLYITEETKIAHNITVHSVSINISVSNLSISLTDGKISNISFNLVASLDYDLTANNERNHVVGNYTGDYSYDFYNYGANTLPEDFFIGDIETEVDKDTWDSQIEQFQFDDILNFSGSGIGYTFTELEGTSQHDLIRLYAGEDWIYYYGQSDETDSFYNIESVTQDGFTYTEYKRNKIGMEGEEYKSEGNLYKKQTSQSLEFDNMPQNGALSTISILGQIFKEFEYDKFTYVDDHYEQNAEIIFAVQEFTNAKIYFKNGHLVKVTFTWSANEQSFDATLTFGYGFSFVRPEKVVA